MHFVELTLENYGAQQLRTLKFSKPPGLTIIYGPNEAGKSTSLAAITDFLFGIPQFSPYGEPGTYAKMRLSATLADATGTCVSYTRRKGMGQTLMDPGGQKLSEAVLSRYLGATDKKQFLSLFGLDHATLRSGGERLLHSDGAIGRLIVEASGGLTALTDKVTALATRRDGIFAPREAKDRLLYRALRTYSEAEAQVNQQTLSLDAFDAAQATLRAAEQRCAALQLQGVQVQASVLSLQRLLRVAPILQTSAQIAARLQALHSVAHLPGKFAAAARSAVARTDAALRTAQDAQARHQAVAQQLAGLKLPKQLLAAAPAILQLHDMAATCRQLQRQVNKDADTLQAAEGSLQKLLTQFTAQRCPDETATPEGALSAESAAAPALRVQQLIVPGSDLSAKVHHAQALVEREATKIQEMQAQQATLQSLGADRPLGVTFEQFSQVAALSAQHQQQVDVQQTLQAQVREAMQALQLPGVEALRAHRCPEVDEVQAEMARSQRATAAIEHLQQQCHEEAHRLRGAQQQLQALGASEVPMGPQAMAQALAAARNERQRHSDVVVQAYQEGAAAVEARPQKMRHADVRAWQAATQSADAMADSHCAAAQNRAVSQQLHREIAAATAKIEADSGRQQALQAQAAAAQQAFVVAWPLPGTPNPQCADYLRFLRGRQAALILADKASAQQLQVAALAAQLAQQQEALCAAEEALKPRQNLDAETSAAQSSHEVLQGANLSQDLGATPSAAQLFLGGLHKPQKFRTTDASAPSLPQRSLTQRLLAVTQALRTHAERHEDHRQLFTALQRSQQSLQVLQAGLQQSVRAQASFEKTWIAALAAMGLPKNTPLAEAGKRATQRVEVAHLKAEVRRLQEARAAAQAAAALLRQHLQALPVDLAEALPTEPLAAADALQAQLNAAQQLQAKHVSCCQQQLVSANECKAKDLELQQARDALAPLQAQAKESSSDLLQLAERSEECHRLLQRQKDLQATLQSAGDGLSPQDLQAELAERSLDTVQAELLMAQATHKQHTEDLQAAREALKQQRQTFDAHAASTALQTATADKESAITDIHAAAADYVAYALATDLLEQAMEKLRAEQQDPLIVHAGQLFAACTQGAFVGMQAGLGDRGEPAVFGKRRTGELVTLSQMSDGSRDQLFLSFRLASIYSYCRAAEPLPFVADDLLVHFDEARSAATLEMLAELGKVTQVLLFTHHQHVLELAQPLIEQEAAAVVRLD